MRDIMRDITHDIAPRRPRFECFVIWMVCCAPCVRQLFKTVDSLSSRDYCVFISQRWLSAEHPDNALRSKFQCLLKGPSFMRPPSFVILHVTSAVTLMALLRPSAQC